MQLSWLARGPIALLLAIGVLTAPASAQASSQQASQQALAERLDQIITSSPVNERATIGVHVVDLATGETLFGRNEERLLLPASNMKLFTSALALTTLGPDYRFVTRVIRDASGDVVLVGSGDPSLSGRSYPYDVDGRTGDPLAAIEQLAAEAVANGLREVNGDIVGDDRLYPWFPYPPSWTEDDQIYDYGAPVSALTLNDNIVRIVVRAGAAPGDLARVSITPGIEYFGIDNRVNTIAGTGGSVRVERVPGTRQFLLRGTIGAGSGAIAFTRAVDDPALFAATAFYQALLNRGVVIRGRPAARHRSTIDRAGPASVTDVHGELLASRESPPLSQLLEVVEKVSQNLHAELMLRESGRVARGSGTLEAGLAAMEQMLKQAGVPDGEWESEDGSGLARNDEVTPHAITHLLTFMDKSEHAAVWRSFLPVGGVDGTLERRLCCVAGRQRISAKTGSLSRSVALSGYAETASGQGRAFSIMVNNFATTSAVARQLVDTIALALTE